MLPEDGAVAAISDRPGGQVRESAEELSAFCRVIAIEADITDTAAVQPYVGELGYCAS